MPNIIAGKRYIQVFGGPEMTHVESGQYSEYNNDVY